MTRALAATSTALQARRRASARARFWTRLRALAVVAAVIAVVLGLVFAGSPDKLAQRHADRRRRRRRPDAGGCARAARAARRAARHACPCTFTAGTQHLPAHAAPARGPASTGAPPSRARSARAAASASSAATGASSSSSSRRTSCRRRAPTTRRSTYELGLIANGGRPPHREARLVRRGLHVTIAAGATGRVLDRAAAREAIVALARVVLARARRAARRARRADGDGRLARGRPAARRRRSSRRR